MVWRLIMMMLVTLIIVNGLALYYHMPLLFHIIMSIGGLITAFAMSGMMPICSRGDLF